MQPIYALPSCAWNGGLSKSGVACLLRERQAVPPGGSTCGSVNPNETVRYALHGTGGSGPCQTAPGPQPIHSCSSPSWSAVIDKAKLVYAVGWYNAQHNVANVSAADHVIGSSPSFCQAVNLSQQAVRAAKCRAQSTCASDASL